MSYIQTSEEVERCVNRDWEEVKMPIVIDQLEKLLRLSQYNEEKSNKLIQGFSYGFGIGYNGSTKRKDMSDNLPLGEVGTKTQLWNKVIKEVRLGHYAGPFKFSEIPFENFVQSPIGLVPKLGGQTRLIFHLSYDFPNGNSSINANTPRERCTVKYKDLGHAIINCLQLLEEVNDKASKNMSAVIFFSKTDLKSAFRILLVLIIDRAWLLMKAEDPVTNEVFYFVEKCLPFGASISCALFQDFSDALQHITEHALNKQNRITNYLDDFLFIALLELECNTMMDKFFEICQQINCPISMEKTEYASPELVFLGILLNGILKCLCIPVDKRDKALGQLAYLMSKRKATIKEVQILTGLLNFLGKAIVPGRAFTRNMYTKLAITDKKGRKLKQHHHVYLDKSFKNDCEIWMAFLESEDKASLCRPFIDWNIIVTSQQLNFYTDASGKIGYGCFFDGRWTCSQWSVTVEEEAKH